MEYVVNYTVVTFCNTLSKIVQTFPPYFVKTPHIIRYKHTTRTTSSIVLHNSSKSMVISVTLCTPTLLQHLL